MSAAAMANQNSIVSFIMMNHPNNPLSLSILSTPAVPSFIVNDTIYRHDGMVISESGARIPAARRTRSFDRCN